MNSVRRAIAHTWCWRKRYRPERTRRGLRERGTAAIILEHGDQNGSSRRRLGPSWLLDLRGRSQRAYRAPRTTRPAAHVVCWNARERALSRCPRRFGRFRRRSCRDISPGDLEVPSPSFDLLVSVVQDLHGRDVSKREAG